jgi:hypothetical protein
MKATIQQLIIEQIYHLLETSTPDTRSTKMFAILLSHLVRWYPQVTHSGTDVYAEGYEVNIENLPISARASQLLDGILATADLTVNEKNRLFREHTHHEHNVPVAVVVRRLIGLVETGMLSEESVADALHRDYCVIIISKDEQRALNGSPNKQYQLDNELVPGAGLSKSGGFYERLDAIGATLIYPENFRMPVR